MKKYIKPEIKVNYFDAIDVIATSAICTCSDPNSENCWHYYNGTHLVNHKNEYSLKSNLYNYLSGDYCDAHGEMVRYQEDA